MPQGSLEKITLLLSDLHHGRPEAASEVMPLVYRHLRLLAARQFQNERPGHTLQPTDLVHELYLRLVKPGKGPWKSRSHFYVVAARAMRQILVDYARAQNTHKRGGRRLHVPLDEAFLVSPKDSAGLLALNRALTRLEEFAPRQGRVVELRYFAGLSIKETASSLGLGVTTVKSEWELAKAWLRQELEGRS